MDGLPIGLEIAASFSAAALLTALATPLAIRLAVRTSFYDHPVGYKKHRRSTPYLGGVALMVGFLGSALFFASDLPAIAAIALAAVALAIVGTVDDRVRLGIGARLAVQVAAALVLWSADVRWDITATPAVNLVVTLIWVVGLVNAFNLMDNLDGATGTVAGVSAAGAGVLAVVEDHAAMAAFAFALSGACLGFLRFNLAKPSRIFLGDGGSMPIGLVVAAIVMGSPTGQGWASLLALSPLAALPIFDTTLIVLSRYRRGAPILNGDRDHLTHRLLSRLGSERSVALVLGGVQALFCGLTIALHALTQEQVAAAAVAYLAGGAIALVVFDGPAWLRHLAREQPA